MSKVTKSFEEVYEESQNQWDLNYGPYYKPKLTASNNPYTSFTDKTVEYISRI